MKIIFLGVGEAFDANQPNNSQLVMAQKTKLLVDCGFTVPSQLWKFSDDPDLLDGVYISHQHSDHFFGLPALLLRMWEGGRERDFTIICQKGLKDSFADFMEFAYRGFAEKFKYKIKFLESADGQALDFKDLKLSFERTVHSGENLAARITDGTGVMAYSGDGSPIEGTNFYNGLDLLILETYRYDEQIIGHSSIVSAIKFAEQNGVKCLALTHINRNTRAKELPGLKDKIKSDRVRIIIPEALEEYEI
jgi:ribonuclease BN (tRNA processing enzyme)